MQMEEGIRLGDVRGILRRRWPVAASIAGGIFLLSIVVAAVLPNEYEAWSTILIEPQRISEKLVEAGMEEADFSARLHLMQMQILSRARLSRIIDDLGLYEQQSQEMTREQVIEMMRGKIRVEPVLPELVSEESRSRAPVQLNTFQIFFRHPSPRVAAQVANRLANDFIEEHIKERVQVSGDTSEFIEAELSRLASRIEAVEGRIAQVKAENPGVLPEEMQFNQQALSRTLESIRETQRALDVARSDEAFYRQQRLAAESYGSSAGDEETSPTQRLESLKLMLGQYEARGLTEKHPTVVATKQEIAALEKRLAGEESDDEEATPLSLPAQNAEAERRRAELRAAGLEQELARLQELATQYQERIARTPRVAERLDALQREWESLSESYREFSAKRLEANVAANMERRQKGQQFRVLESAFPPPDPASPNRPVILVLGLMLGMAMGGAVAVLLEATDGSFHGARELQTALRIPVLTAVPSILFDADRAARRRRVVRLGAAVSVLTLAVLMGSAGGYWWVNVAGGGGEQVEPQGAGSQEGPE